MTEQANANALVPAAETKPPQREIRVVNDDVAVFDTAKFEHMQRIAGAMASSSLIPDSLRTYKDTEGTVQILPMHAIVANCFLVVNQAHSWKMNPIAVAQCTSLVHGKLMFEGKLVHAVIEQNLGIRLRYDFNDKPGKELGVRVVGRIAGEDFDRDIEGTVAQWHKGEKSPWANPPDWKRQLRYRGAREWARAHAPGVMLGVVTEDEAEDFGGNARTINARSDRVSANHADLAAPALFSSDVPTAKGTTDVAAELVQEGVSARTEPEAALDATARRDGSAGGDAGAATAQSANVTKGADQTATAGSVRSGGEASGTGGSNLFGKSSDEGPDDRETVCRDIIAQLQGAAGNAARLDMIAAETKADFDNLDEPRQTRVREAFVAAKAKGRKAA